MNEQRPSKKVLSPRNRLWDYLQEQHELVLLESELNEIIDLAVAADEPPDVLEPAYHTLPQHIIDKVNEVRIWFANQGIKHWHVAGVTNTEPRTSQPPADPLAVSHLRGLVYHWNEFGPAMCLEEKMHYAHEWLKRHDESTSVTKGDSQ